MAKIAYLYHQGGVWQGTRVIDEAWVQASIAPSVTVSEATGVKYGFKWWLYPYARGDSRTAFGGSGFGGQMPLVIPDYDIVIVVNAWNIAGGKRLGPAEAISRVIAAVKESGGGASRPRPPTPPYVF
jgi:CubicO group peptidase (beta-lactamase class C family)